jgi:quinol monooxygenase YgiN
VRDRARSGRLVDLKHMTDNIVTVIAHIKVKPGLEDRAKQALLAAVAQTREEEGCLDYDLHQSTSDPTEFVFYENWASEEALKAHSSSTARHRLALGQQLGGLVDGPPRVTFWQRVG